MKKHINIPIFIPHLGCPNDCVFCNQRKISGHIDFNKEDVRKEIETALATKQDGTNAEIAFFGGSFTGIDRELMIYLLDVAKEYADRGDVSAIRLSTRPDYISDEILSVLKKYPVKTVELGIQSVSDEVLLRSRRGHRSDCIESACAKVKAAGFELIGQMMIGLPAADSESEIATAEMICQLGADGARVYPTVVFRDTELCNMSVRGEYTPLSIDEAVERTKNVLNVFARYGVPCIRVGLCASETLSSEEEVYGGANHSAIGELAMGEVFYCKIRDKLSAQNIRGGDVTVLSPLGTTSKVIGQKGKNRTRLKDSFGLNTFKVIEDKALLDYDIRILYGDTEI